MKPSVRWALFTSALCLAACGDDTMGAGGSGSAGGGGGGGDDAAGTTTATTGAATTTATGAATTTGSGGGDGEGGGGGSAVETWSTLITGEWSLEPGGELTSAIYTAVVDHATYVGAIRPIAPFGTHHTVLAIENISPGNYIYASGVDTNELRFPEGVGLLLAEGSTLVLQLHVFNPTGEPLEAVSGIEVIEVAPEDIVHEADIFLPGPVDLEIPANSEHSQSSTCVVDAEQTLFALFPHMHQLGSHFRTTVTRGGEEIVLHDEDYEFDHQPFVALDSITLQPGDGITTECTWDNTTNQQVGWGESSTAEMCFSILMRWPKQDAEQSFCP